VWPRPPSSDVSEIKLVFSIPPERPTPNFAPSWNVAPTDPLPVVHYDIPDGQRSLDITRAGACDPLWAKDTKIGFSTINARAEEIDTKPAFREAFRQRRCLVPLDNFYEWAKTPTGKQRYAIGLKGGGLMAMVGSREISARRKANVSAASRSRRRHRTSSAPSFTTACPWC
jgi:putative SOS response-associated peptidase YedK